MQKKSNIAYFIENYGKSTFWGKRICKKEYDVKNLININDFTVSNVNIKYNFNEFPVINVLTPGAYCCNAIKATLDSDVVHIDIIPIAVWNKGDDRSSLPGFPKPVS
jgi:hypothetical protein